MATYIVLGQFTEQGIKNVKKTTERAKAIQELAKMSGITVKEIYWTLGHHDVVMIAERRTTSPPRPFSFPPPPRATCAPSHSARSRRRRWTGF